jgi:hypothetical protein
VSRNKASQLFHVSVTPLGLETPLVAMINTEEALLVRRGKLRSPDILYIFNTTKQPVKSFQVPMILKWVISMLCLSPGVVAFASDCAIIIMDVYKEQVLSTCAVDISGVVKTLSWLSRDKFALMTDSGIKIYQLSLATETITKNKIYSLMVSKMYCDIELNC